MDITLTFITMAIIDVFMNSISIPIHTEILFAILSYLLSQCVDFFDKDTNYENRNSNNHDENDINK